METYVAIGIDKQTDKVIAIGAEARAQSIYVIGKTRTGKSNLLETIASQDMQNGDGLCFLDPHGDSAKKLLASVPSHREKHVIFWDPRDIDRPFGLNPFYCADTTNSVAVDSKAQNFVEALASLKEFEPIFAGGAPRMKNMLKQLALAFILNQGHTLAETPKFLTNKEYREQFYPELARHGYLQAAEYWQRFDLLHERVQDERVESSLNKLEQLLSDSILYGIFGQRDNSIDFRRAMDQQQIIIVDLTLDPGGFIGAFIVWEIYQEALSRVDLPPSERKPFHLFSDEFQTYLTTAFPKLQSETPKFGVDTAVAHQVREQLEGELPELTRAVGNLIIFQVTYPNALAGEFDTTPPPGELVLKPVTTRVTVVSPQYEMRWVDRDAKDLYNQLTHEIGRIYAYFSLLGLATGLRAYFPIHVDWLLQRVTEKPDDPWFYYVFAAFNPAYGNPRVFQYWADKLYLVHSREHSWDWQLKSFERQAVYFPSSVAWGIEVVLEDWIFTTSNPGDSLYRFAKLPREIERDVTKLESEEIRQIARKLLEDVKPFVAKLKEQTTGTYYFNPAISGLPPDQDWFDERPIRSQMRRIVDEKEREDPKKSWYGGGDREGGYWELQPRPEVLPWLVEKATALKRELDPKLVQAADLYKSYQAVETVPGVYDDQVIRHELVPGPQKSPDQVKDGIANEIVHLPKYQARCKLTQRQGSPTEHTIRALHFPGEGAEDYDQAQRIIARSRNTFGRDRQSVVRAIEKRLQIMSQVNVDDEEPIIREKATARNKGQPRLKRTPKNGIQRRSS